jgi:hypothetical protein
LEERRKRESARVRGRATTVGQGEGDRLAKRREAAELGSCTVLIEAQRTPLSPLIPALI